MPTKAAATIMTSFSPASTDETAAAQCCSIVDTPPEPAFDDLARRAAEALGAPMAAISFFDGSREWFKACHGITLQEWQRQLSFFREQQPFSRVLCVADANADTRFGRHPLVAGAPRLRFYAGAAIMAGDGSVCGVLSVFDVKPREMTARDSAALCNLADLVQARLAARRDQRAEAGKARSLSRE